MKSGLGLSIIVPIYNAEKYINRCMNSIYAQTFTDYEIILVNDGSQDRSAEICREYQELDDRVTVINKDNGGAGSARNAGIAIARGEYVAFPDVDDWFEPEMYDSLYRLAKSENYDVVLSGVNYYIQTPEGEQYSRTEYCRKVVGYKTKEECRKNVMVFFPTTTIFDVPWNKLYKRSVLIDNNIRFKDIRRCQDAVFNLDFYNCAQSIASSEKAFYNYMENTASDVQRKFPQNYSDICIYYYNHLMEIFAAWGIYEGKIKEHYDSSFVIAIFSSINMYDNPKWCFSKGEQRKYIEDILNKSEITQLLANAIVREDVKKQYRMVKDKQIDRIILEHDLEAIKEKLRNNQILMSCYHFFRRDR